MIYAGLSTNPNAEPEKWRYNCIRNASCQREYYMPLNNVGQLDLYFDLPFMPQTYSLHLVDACNGFEYNVISGLYVVGQHTRGFYGVFSSLASITTPKIFYFKAEFHKNADTAIFYSNDFSTIDCERITRVEGCYNNPTLGTEAFDINGIYYGYPVNDSYLGNPNWRYYHSVLVRMGKVTNTGHKLSLNLFNNKRNFRSTTTKQYNFQSEVVPEFYKDIILGVYTRGNIMIETAQYTLESEINLQVHSEESELWVVDVPLSKTIDTFFSCKETVCRSLVTIPPVVECCTPVIISATVEEIAEPAKCIKYYVQGYDNLGEVAYTNCDGTETGNFWIGSAGISVCSITEPITEHCTVEVSNPEFQDCNGQGD